MKAPALNPELIREWREKARAHNYSVGGGSYDPAMTFEEIAAVMGTDKKHVWHWYARAIKKLRAHPEALAQLLAQADALSAERDRRRFVEAVR